MPIDRPGTFRGIVSEWGVSTSSGGFPQFVCRLTATEYYDEMGAYGEPGAWLDWAPYGQDIVAYLVLFNAKGPLKNAEQLQEALGWDGSSFQTLGEGDWSKSVIQFRVADEDYEGQLRRKVQWVSKHDADPNRSIKKLDPASLKGLDVKYNLSGLKKPPPAAPPAAPAPAPPAPADRLHGQAPTAPAAAAAPAPAAPPTTAPAPAPAAAAPAPAPAPAAPAAPPATPPAASTDDKKDLFPKTTTKLDAWATIHKLKTDPKKDISDEWVDACKTVLGDTDEDEATPEQWAQVRDEALEHVDHVPF